jgi:hypothetical protein
MKLSSKERQLNTTANKTPNKKTSLSRLNILVNLIFIKNKNKRTTTLVKETIKKEFERYCFFSLSSVLEEIYFTEVIFRPKRIKAAKILAITKTKLYLPYPSGPIILPAKMLTANKINPLKNMPKKDQDKFLMNFFISRLISCPKMILCKKLINSINFFFILKNIKLFLNTIYKSL